MVCSDMNIAPSGEDVFDPAPTSVTPTRLPGAAAGRIPDNSRAGHPGFMTAKDEGHRRHIPFTIMRCGSARAGRGREGTEVAGRGLGRGPRA